MTTRGTTTRRRASVLLVFLYALAGCDVFGSTDNTVRVSGRVVDAETGAPLAGIFVYIHIQSPIRVPLAEAYTGPGGRFALEHNDGPRPETFVVEVNSTPDYDRRYVSSLQFVRRGETVDFGDIPLGRTDATDP